VSRVVGIDLGTTNSLVAYVKDGVPVVIRDRGGDALLPSIVSAGSDGTIYVGREAQRRLLTDAAHTVYSVKRFMGKGLDDVKGEASLLPFRVGGESGGVVRIGLGEREFTPPEISAFILRELKRRAEAFFAEQGEVDNEVDRAVITVPAYFNDARARDTRRRPDRRPRRDAHHQRTDRRVARYRPRQTPCRAHRGLRFRRRHVRHFDSSSRGRCSRCSPPAATTHSAATTSTCSSCTACWRRSGGGSRPNAFRKSARR
jgi:hypothetical protein